MSARSYLSIGDVLTLLRQEFPDVTISKIRFLESQGLVNPERTPSGYRKFYEHDVERLRWVLRQQREHFLPLKVIKDRLDDEDGGTPVSGDSAAPAAAAAQPTVAADDASEPVPEEATVLVGADARAIDGDGAGEPSSGLPGIEAVRHRAPARTAAAAGPVTSAVTSDATTPAHRAHRASLATPSGLTASPSVDATPSATPSPAPAAVATNGASNGAAAPGPTGHAAPASDTDPPPAKASKAPGRRAAGAPARSKAAAATTATTGTTAATAASGGSGGGAPGEPTVSSTGLGGASLSLDDLCAASGLTPEGIGELQEYGLLSANVAAGVEFFDEEALAVANLAAAFASYGIEARHLRLYKNAADREAGFIEQIVIPMVRQRNPEARARATRTAEELSHLGQQLKASLLRTDLRDIL